MFEIEKPDNLVEHFEISTEKFKNNLFFGTKNPQTLEYEWITYGDVRNRVDNLRSGLANYGLQKDEAVGIIATNRTEWAVAMFATVGLGGRYIPMYQNEILRTWQYIIRDSSVKVLFVANMEIYEKIKHLKDEIESLEHIFVIEGDSEYSMKHLEDVGAKKPVKSVVPKPSDIAVLIYTSGTTGEPKGVLLSHGNLTSNARAGYHLYSMLNEESRSISILPWAHSYGITAELINWLFFGGSIGFMEKVESLGSDLEKIQPTFIIAVPRVFNKIFDGIHNVMKEKGGLAKFLFDMGLKSARTIRLSNGNASAFTKFKFNIADKIVFKKFRAKFGGQAKAALTASAIMNENVSLFFRDIGLPVFDCYGLSETSPAVTMNAPHQFKQGSVGKPLEFIQVRIDRSMIDDKSNDGEIQVFGPNLMQGYHNKPEATAEIFTPDGWLKTGDRGTIDSDGYVFITGRIKEQYKLENGKYVFPAALEEDIRLLPYIENAMIYGEGKQYNVCLVIPDINVLKRIAEQMHVKTNIDKLIHSPIVQEFMKLEIRKHLQDKYSPYEIPRKFLLVNDNFSIEDGTLTQTLKLKRKAVIEKYFQELEALYQE